MSNLNGLLGIFGKTPIENKECIACTIDTITISKPHHQIYLGMGMKGEIKEPHIHVFRTGNDCLNWIRGVPLSLIRDSYIIHDEKFIGLSSTELEAINKFMHRMTKIELNSTKVNVIMWEKLITLWNTYNERYAVNVISYNTPSYNFYTIKKGRSVI